MTKIERAGMKCHHDGTEHPAQFSVLVTRDGQADEELFCCETAARMLADAGAISSTDALAKLEGN